MNDEVLSGVSGVPKRYWLFAAFFIVALVIFGWWKYEFPSATWRYKMTVTIETPEGLRTGSAVREVTYINGPKILPDVAGSQWKVKGEAVVVDLGHDKYLFAIMDVDGSYQIVYDAFPYTPTSARDGIRYYKSITGQKKILDKSQYPTLVTFKDIKDPKTVELVYGGKFAPATQKIIPVDDFEKFFGKELRIKDVTIQMTDEKVTIEINKYLEWLANVKKGSLDGSFTNHSTELSNILHYGYFKREE